MNVSDDDEQRVLSAARRALAPTAGDARRVRAALEATLIAPPVDAPTTGHVPPSAAVRLIARLALPALVALGGVTGYELGHRAGFRAGTAAASAERRASEPAPPPSPPPASAETSRTEAPRLVPPPEPLTRMPRSSIPPSAGAEGARPGAASAGAVGPRLDDEVRLVRRVEHALREGNPRYALALLGELERQIPRGQLMEERDAASAMARCELGAGGDEIAKSFDAAHPESAYASRVAETCAKAPKESR